MGKYIVKRLLMMIPVILAVAILIFTIMTFVPGNPASLILGADATEEHRQEIISQRQSDLYNEVLQGWKDEAEWVLKDKVWDKVTFDNLFTTTVESTETTETTESSTTDNAVTENTEAVEGTESVQS